MRNPAVAVAMLVLVGPASAAGWVTVVEDGSAGRNVFLRGETAEDPELGIALVCGKPVVAVFASAPSKNYAVGPGAASLVVAGNQAIVLAEVTRNDSRATIAVGEVVDLPGLFDIFRESASPMAVYLANVDGAAVAIPADGMAPAIAEFEQACVL